jgi:hypothetical protein
MNEQTIAYFYSEEMIKTFTIWQSGHPVKFQLTPPNRNSAPAAMTTDKISSFLNIFLARNFFNLRL